MKSSETSTMSIGEAYEITKPSIKLLEHLSHEKNQPFVYNTDVLKAYISSNTLNELLLAKDYIGYNYNAYVKFRNRVIRPTKTYKGFQSKYHTFIKLIQALELAKIDGLDDKNFIHSFYDICFAPGAFTEGLLRLYDCSGFGITLIHEGLLIDETIASNPKFKVISPEDGDLYKYENLELAISEAKDGVDLACADGGFGVSDENLQSLYVYKLIFCEFVHAICTLAKGGIFVCKLFDTFDERTVQAIAALSMYFEKTYITKPTESRIVNSERYIVCIGFNPDGLDALTERLKEILRTMTDDGMSMIFDEITSTAFKKNIRDINEDIAKKQTIAIRDTVYKCIELASKSRRSYHRK